VDALPALQVNVADAEVNLDPGAGALMLADPDTVPPAMFTGNAEEKADTTAVLVALRAWAFTP
jgi:hypothetical protein